MKIDFQKAIRRRKREIRQLAALQKKMQRLIDDARRVEHGKQPILGNTAWESMRREVEDEMVQLGLATHCNMPCFRGFIGIPPHWAMAEIVS